MVQLSGVVIESFETMAEVAKVYFNALRDRGFTTEQSMKLVEIELSRPSRTTEK